jgi:hypothetical protein
VQHGLDRKHTAIQLILKNNEICPCPQGGTTIQGFHDIAHEIQDTPSSCTGIALEL